MITGNNMTEPSGDSPGCEGLVDVVGRSPGFLHVVQQARQVAASHAAVLLRGEVGVGKSFVAAMIHRLGARSRQPYVRFSCVGLTESGLDRALFSEQGAIERAHGGTLFLEEVGELSQPAQARLLRVLQDREFERFETSDVIRVDVRVIASTRHSLEERLQDGRFRADLYYRLNVFPIAIPPLRDRKEDIPLLVAHLLSRHAGAGRGNLRLTAAAMDVLVGHSWPGNVRELENCILHAVASSSGSILEGRHVIPVLRPGIIATTAAVDLHATLQAVERAMIQDALEANGGHMGAAARQLGLTQRIMSLRVHKYGIDLNQYRR